ncbi:MAG: hypothetical protein U1E68_10910 [Sphingomonadaceae bacterium]|jgi:hypothetical protein
MVHESIYTICKTAFASGDLRTCEPLGLSLADWATIAGFFIVVMGLSKFAVIPVVRHFNSSNEKSIRNFRGLKKALRRSAADNKRIFRTFGPKSGAMDEDFEKFDVAAWHQARLNIRNNNQEILALLQKYSHLIPARFEPDFTKWINHIQAFSAHLEDPKVDYRHHRFPPEVDTILKL